MFKIFIALFRSACLAVLLKSFPVWLADFVAWDDDDDDDDGV